MGPFPPAGVVEEDEFIAGALVREVSLGPGFQVSCSQTESLNHRFRVPRSAHRIRASVDGSCTDGAGYWLVDLGTPKAAKYPRRA
jgi:hypothetical protein